MLLERIYDDDLAQAGYLIGCQATGEAIVIDARRDIAGYLKLAEKQGMQITKVTETHIHADYLSGTRELAAATGAEIYLSGEGGPDWQYDFDGTLLHDGDQITLGNITITARHTPGHTPEHLAFLVTDGAFSDDPGYLISGDFVFSGDLGRPDLLDEAAGGKDTRFGGARQIFASLRDVFLKLPDHVMVYPGHGSGSACGKALGALPSTTVGYERLNAWWAKYLEADDEQGFVDELLDGQPDAHAYFGRMKRQNRQGPAILGERATPEQLSAEELAGRLDQVTLVDTRPIDEVHQGTAVGAINLPDPDKLATHGAWGYDPESDNRPLVLLADDAAAASTMIDSLIRVGIDEVEGYLPSFDAFPQFTPPLVAAADLAEHGHVMLLDVRNKQEYQEGHVPGAEQLSASRVLWHQDQLPDTGTIVTYCQTGKRNSVAASSLRRAGHDVVELDGSYEAWQAWDQAR